MRTALFLMVFPLLVGCATTPKKSSNLPKGFVIDETASGPFDGNEKDWKSKARKLDGAIRDYRNVINSLDGFTPRFTIQGEIVYTKDDLVRLKDNEYTRQDFLQKYSEHLRLNLSTAVSTEFIENIACPLANELLNGTTVSILVMSKINVNPEKYYEQFKTLSDMWVTGYNGFFLKVFGGNVSVVDRSKMDFILKEKKLSLSGLTDKEFENIGKLTSANFILYIEKYVEVISPEKGIFTDKYELVRTSKGEIIGICLDYSEETTQSSYQQ